MTKTLAEMGRLEKNLARNLRYSKRRRKRDLYCTNCEYIMPHIIPIDTGGRKYDGVRWECLGCANITVEEKT